MAISLFRGLQRGRRRAKIFPEMFQRAHDRVGREAAERAQRAEFHGVAEVFDHGEVFGSAFAARDGLIGHGGIVVFDDTVDLAQQARFAMEFCAEESCGKCTPCRVGSVRGMEVIDRIVAGERAAANLELLRDLCHTMKFGSLCALGGFIPYPVMSALEHFPEDFRPAHREAAE